MRGGAEHAESASAADRRDDGASRGNSIPSISQIDDFMMTAAPYEHLTSTRFG